MDVVFKEEPAVEIIGRMDEKTHTIHIGGNGRKALKNEDLRDGELVLIRFYKIDYNKTIK